jgi:hypothetical protein
MVTSAQRSGLARSADVAVLAESGDLNFSPRVSGEAADLLVSFFCECFQGKIDAILTQMGTNINPDVQDGLSSSVEALILSAGLDYWVTKQIWCCTRFVQREKQIDAGALAEAVREALFLVAGGQYVANIGFDISTREGVSEAAMSTVLAAFMFLLVSHRQAFRAERLQTLRIVCKRLAAVTNYEVPRQMAVVSWIVLLVDFEMNASLQVMPPDVDDEERTPVAKVIWQVY